MQFIVSYLCSHLIWRLAINKDSKCVQLGDEVSLLMS